MMLLGLHVAATAAIAWATDDVSSPRHERVVWGMAHGLLAGSVWVVAIGMGWLG